MADAPSPPLWGRNACGGGRQAGYLFRDAKRGLVPRGGNSLTAALEGADPLTAARPSLEGREGVGWMRFTQDTAKMMIHTRDRDAGPLPHTPEPPLARRCSDRQALPILGLDLICQMLTQRVLAVRPEIIVEIPEPWFQHMAFNPGIKGSGAQPFRCPLPGRIAVDGDVKALHPLRQQDGTEVTR